MIKNIKFANFKKEKVDDEIIDVTQKGFKDIHEYIEFEIERYMKKCDDEDLHYFVSFDAKYKFDFGFEHMFEIVRVEEEGNNEYFFEWYTDWCEGETIIRKLHIYSESELEFVCKMLDEGGAVLI